MDAPKISVVIPLFNKERGIERCLRSVEAQTLAPHEVLVVDDGSTDESAAIAGACATDRTRLIRQSNRGAAAARNRGISESTGDRIAFLDADDEWKPAFLETVVRLSQRFPEAAIWACGYEEISAPGALPIRHRSEGLPTDPGGALLDDFFRSMYRFPPVCSINALFPREVFDKVGLFPEGELLAEDWDMWSRIALQYPVAYDPHVAAIYHTHAANRATVRLRFGARDTALLRTLQAALRGNAFPFTSRASVQRFAAKHLLEIARHNLAAGERRAARSRIGQAWRLRVLPAKCLGLWFRTLA